MTSQSSFADLGQKAEAHFEEPWQGQLFALTVELSRQGLFSWSEWVGVFSAEIVASPMMAGETVSSAYYRQWLAAFERILAGRIDLATQTVGRRVEEWRRAYLLTPHGQPVDLCVVSNTAEVRHSEHNAHHHHHHHHHHHDHSHGKRPTPRPIFVSPAQTSAL